jgi:cobalamin synthase
LKLVLIFTWLGLPDVHSAAILFAVPIWSRWFVVIAIAGWPYARKEGLGGFTRNAGSKHVLLATALALPLSFFGIWVGGIAAAAQMLLLSLTMLGIAGIGGWLIASYFSRKLGGLTGDTYGAVNEMLEVVLLLFMYPVYTNLL